MTIEPICPRCACSAVEQQYTSPVPGVWDVLQCRQCLYMWRTTEPARRTRRETYPEQFRMTAEDIKNAPEVPSIPPLRRGHRAHAGNEESDPNR
ncbi:non-oxidative hydroxyarylic acid decarboxylases subunit D [Pseudonocardia sp. CA-142604]|uniref:non-oxidative hydroxyarylic acid decarboxylases subunit D n=1 Tax=Pseudonocardia sp. CA-142604 TaxID=3240024 RepID=UPI003D948A95